MDESRALEILNVKAGVYHRLKAERKREEVILSIPSFVLRVY